MWEGRSAATSVLHQFESIPMCDCDSSLEMLNSFLIDNLSLEQGFLGKKFKNPWIRNSVLQIFMSRDVTHNCIFRNNQQLKLSSLPNRVQVASSRDEASSVIVEPSCKNSANVYVQFLSYMEIVLPYFWGLHVKKLIQNR